MQQPNLKHQDTKLFAELEMKERLTTYEYRDIEINEILFLFQLLDIIYNTNNDNDKMSAALRHNAKPVSANMIFDSSFFFE